MTETTNTGGTEVGSAPTPSTPASGIEGDKPREGASVGEITSESQEVSAKRKPCRAASAVWGDFKKDVNKIICLHCGKQYSVNSSTATLSKHIDKCAKNPNKQSDKRQKTIALRKGNEGEGTVTMKLVEFKQDESRLGLAKMVIIDELPFKFVENTGFRAFMSMAQSRFKVPSRVTIAKDCMQVYREERELLRSLLELNHQMVSFTTDTWTSIQNMNYMCVTAHFIDDGWELHKKILSFALIPDHKGETIGRALEKCMKDWGIVKICTVTVDNASSNNTALSYLLRGMDDWNGTTLLKGEYMHMRCNAHILNLSVTDGLKEIDVSVVKIRASCKYVTSSPSRAASFRKCVVASNIACTKEILLDMPTRWNSAYLMLEVAEKYEKAFARLRYDDDGYVSALISEGGVPTVEDWSRARVFIKFLRIFYEATLAFSGSLNVTSNVFFDKLFEIQINLANWIRSEDLVLRRMASNMKAKFDKYWDFGRINYLLFVAVFLDPRYKLAYVELCFKHMYDENKASEALGILRELIKQIFDQYALWYPIPNECGDTSSQTTITSTGNQASQDYEDPSAMVKELHRKNVRKKQGEIKKSELERYLDDDFEEPPNNFDILKWWSFKSVKYHVLSRMARDILAIPVSTVSSESAFSTGGVFLIHIVVHCVPLQLRL